jgi:hypothetical protein
MRKTLRQVMTVFATIGLIISLGAVPAQAAKLNLTRAGYTCTVDVYKPSLGAEATQGACGAVQVRLKYSNYGTVVTLFGVRGYRSSAAAGTSAIIERAVSATISNGFSNWKSY